MAVESPNEKDRAGGGGSLPHGPREREEHLPAPPYYPDLELRPGGEGRWFLRHVPPWVAAWAGKPPGELEGEPLPGALGELGEALATTAAEITRRKNPVQDWCVEFTDASGEERAVLVRAWNPGWEEGSILVRLHEVSLQVREQKETGEKKWPHGIVGKSPGIRKVLRRLELFGPALAPVLVTGESGTGKELVARGLHRAAGERSKGPFVALNCAALSPDLLESELFGHEKGAFTGAVRNHKGRFERAHGGTLFLDEIGDLPLPAQAKLLRALESGRIERVGGEREFAVDVRVVSATNRPLEESVARKSFREDLYHRITVLRIHIPPLRERKEDIPLLVDYFLGRLSEKYGKRIIGLTRQAMAVLLSYKWPGNVRELKNTLERVFIETRTPVIGWRALEEWVRERAALAGEAPVPPRADPIPLETSLPAVSPASRKLLEREEILQALESSRWNASEAARRLGIHRATLYRRMKDLGIQRP